MSRRRAYSEDTLGVMQRTFEAVDALVDSKTIRGVKTYCDAAGVDRRHYYAQKLDNGAGFWEISWMLPLIRKFSVSYKWILFGVGDMFTKRRTPMDLPSE